MLTGFHEHPGRLFLLAAALPLAAAVVMLTGGAARFLARRSRYESRFAGLAYWLLGGDQSGRAGGHLAVACAGAAAVVAGCGLVRFLGEAVEDPALAASASGRWAERADWVRITPDAIDPRPALALELGYRIDHFSAVLLVMVAGVAFLISVFSLGYMAEEAAGEVEDHAAHARRRGRHDRFFLYLSLFSPAMMALLLADNLFQVFLAWEVVGVCSYFLIGFYSERRAASAAATKAFLVNRVGDAGFLIGLAVIWSQAGTFHFEELSRRLRSPEGELVAVRPTALGDSYVPDPAGDFVALHPVEGASVMPESIPADGAGGLYGFQAMPYGLLVLAGAGVFLGCAGKSAQFPLHAWLPDAMEGPTPVSALIHAATMVAAGVYLVGRCYPLFAPEVLLAVACIGALTLVLGATVALVMTDIKRVLAYSTVSQLGYMMLALGVGGWVAGLLHLVTHAFFKALLFLATGSVIHACGHEQDVTRMGGLRRKMPITAGCMLVGVLAIAGTPLLSGWYSKDRILAEALGYTAVHPARAPLLIAPVLTAGVTAFYMFRLWFLTFAGNPRDPELHARAHESPAVMTVPLLILAAASAAAGWGLRPWDAEASYVGELLARSEPPAAGAEFVKERIAARQNHLIAGGLGLVAGAAGFWLAWRLHRAGRVLRDGQPSAVGRLLERRYHVDDAYEVAAVRPAVALARSAAGLDRGDDPAGPVTLDSAASLPARLLFAAGLRLRGVQSGQVRRYVLLLALTALGLLAILSASLPER